MLILTVIHNPNFLIFFTSGAFFFERDKWRSYISVSVLKGLSTNFKVSISLNINSKFIKTKKTYYVYLMQVSKTDARGEVLSDSVSGIYVSNQHRIWVCTDFCGGIINSAGQLVLCFWAAWYCSSLVTGYISGRSVSLKRVYLLM